MGNPEQFGLCSTCNDVEKCTGRESWNGPVMFCEQFDNDVLPAMKKSEPAKETKKTTTNNNVTSERRGLCANCLHSATCAFPKIEGGVWHCEEYE